MDVVKKLSLLLNQRDRRQFWVLLAVLLIVALIEMIGIASILPFMAVVTNPDTIHSNQGLHFVYESLGFSSDQDFLIFLGLAVLSLLVIGNGSKALSTWLTLRFHNRLYYFLARRLLATYMNRPYQFFLGRNTSELGKNILGEIQVVIGGVLDPVTLIISSSLVCFSIMSLLVFVNPGVAAAIALVLGGAYGAIYLIARRKLSAVGEQQVQANLEKYKHATEALNGIKDLKVLGREITFLRRFGEAAERHADNNVIVGVISQLPRFALEIIAFGGILLVVLYFVQQGEEASNMVPLLALYAFAGYRLMPTLQQLFASISKLRTSIPALDVVYNDFLSGRAAQDDAEEVLRQTTDSVALKFDDRIKMENIEFRYQESQRPALRSLNIEIRKNTSVGLVGPTGCGKTTTVDIILGLLAPSSGVLEIDGIEITEKNRRHWQQNIGYVPQHIYISDDTIARNIAFGVPDSDIDMKSIRRAAEIANLAEFVETDLADGYGTEIGERGVRLSGGQRQRIGIARAMYKDPSVLIMDEATSALDGITEESVMDAVNNLSRKKTVILIAHRLTTVMDCDEIFLLEAGRVIAQGSYNDLMKESQWFRSAART